MRVGKTGGMTRKEMLITKCKLNTSSVYGGVNACRSEGKKAHACNCSSPEMKCDGNDRERTCSTFLQPPPPPPPLLPYVRVPLIHKCNIRETAILYKAPLAVVGL